MAKKTNFGPNFGLFTPKSGPKFFFSVILPWRVVKHYSKLLSYKIKKKPNEQSLRKKDFNPPEFFREFYLYE